MNNIVELSQARRAGRSGDTSAPVDGDDQRPIIRLETGELNKVVKQVDEVFCQHDSGLYKQGNRLITLVWEKILTAGGGHGSTIRLSTVTVPHLLERVSAIARFEAYNFNVGDWLRAGCPEQVAQAYLARDGRWSVPFILGVITAPTLRPDGTLLDTPGYDAATGLVFNPLGVEFLPVPDQPTRADAEAALRVLMEPLAEFPLEGAALSVVLSGIITTVVRRALPTAPMHAYSASTAGSGKSMLVDIAAMIATGHPAAVTSTGRDKFGDAELEKRLTSSMLAGDAVLSLDNLETPLGGELLCQLLTQTAVKLRPLGKSVNVEVPVTTSFFATGNNLTVVGDLTRRVLVGSFDVGEERPELREFTFNPLTMVRQRRPEFVRAVLTLVRAYVCCTDKVCKPPLGSYEDWSRLVRDPLIWLGLEDPVSVLEQARANDPRLGKLKDMVRAWAEAFGDNETLVAKAVDTANAQFPNAQPGEQVWQNPDLREALHAVAGEGRAISNEKLGWWLKKNAGRLVDGCRFVRVDGARKATWRLEGAAGRNVLNVTAQQVGPLGELDEEIPF